MGARQTTEPSDTYEDQMMTLVVKLALKLPSLNNAIAQLPSRTI